LFWIDLGKYRELARGFIQSSELKAGILRSSVGVLVGKSQRIAGYETRSHRGPAQRVIDNDEPPRLAEANRRGELVSRRRVSVMLCER
jgi:hypothetical protein